MATWQLAFNTKGPQGIAGSPGSVISFLTQTQYNSLSSTSGNNGDAVFTTDTNYFYQKTNGAWPSGGSLLRGAMGVTGVNGASFYSGAGAPTSSSPASPNNGDLYVNLAGGEIYKYTNGAWSDQGYSIQGPQGVAGTPGNRNYFGTTAPSSTSGYNAGDQYTNTSTGDVYYFSA